MFPIYDVGRIGWHQGANASHTDPLQVQAQFHQDQDKQDMFLDKVHSSGWAGNLRKKKTKKKARTHTHTQIRERNKHVYVEDAQIG